MLCSATTSAVLLASCMLVSAARAQAPAPGRPKSILYAQLEDPSGNPVAGATGWLVPEPRRRLVALPSYVPRGRNDRPRAFPTATSDKRGVLRFDGGEQAPGAGSGLVSTEQGLGAVLPRLFARRLLRVTLEPMAEVTTPTGSEPFVLHARARLPDGHRVELPPQRGKRVRLPAGDYEVWARSADGWTWQRLVLRPGGRALLKFDGAAQRVRVAADAYLHPDGWPTMPLRGYDDERELLLRGNALAAPLVTWTDERVAPARVLPGPPTVAPIAWPPADDRQLQSLATNAPGATLYGLVRKERGGYRLVARAVADAQGAVTLPADPGGDSWLLAEGSFAPFAVPWSRAAGLAGVQAVRGVPLTVQARSGQNLPVADLICTYEPVGMAAAAVVARTDAVGVASFGLLRGPGVLTIDDPRYANQRIELEAVPTRTLEVAVQPGESCRGAVTFADGFANATIVLTLRDPRGLLRPAERTVALRPGEEFAFDGLPAETGVVLFATATRGGKTWSARRTVRSGAEGIALVLSNEDPEFGR